MRKLNNKLSLLKCDKILDVATRDGAFINRLKDNLDEYKEIIGIDISNKGYEKARSNFREDENIKFRIMDAYETSFPDNYFDLICISNSLHHMKDTSKLLNEMKRIKKENGLILISEIPSTGQFGSSLTHALIHDLDSDIDTLNGIYHHKAYSHEKIKKKILNNDLKIIEDFNDREINKYSDTKIEARVGKAFEKIKKFRKNEDYDKLYKKALKIQENFNKYGASRAIQYIIFAK